VQFLRALPPVSASASRRLTVRERDGRPAENGEVEWCVPLGGVVERARAVADEAGKSRRGSLPSAAGEGAAAPARAEPASRGAVRPDVIESILPHRPVPPSTRSLSRGRAPRRSTAQVRGRRWLLGHFPTVR
jgi:hypothetical protein